jgi:hypothetical protein
VGDEPWSVEQQMLTASIRELNVWINAKFCGIFCGKFRQLYRFILADKSFAVDKMHTRAAISTRQVRSSESSRAYQ